MGTNFFGTLIITATGFAPLYFWLLNELSDGAIHYVIMVGELLIVLV